MDLEDLSDNTEQTKTPKTRSEYLHGKTELSDVDIIHILDLPVEKRSINNEIYTDKSYKELKNNPEELSSLTENLKTKPEYLKYHSSYIAKSKLLYQESDVLCNEIPCLMVLNQLKKTSYLLPYEYASNKSGTVITSADALKSNTFTDFKRVFNSRLKKLIEKGITQGKDIFFLINNKKLSHDEIKSQLIRFLNNRTSENKEGTYLFFSEKNFVCYSFESDKNGFITELPEYDLKEIRAAISSKPLTPSRESEKTSDSLASNLNITQEKSDVNELFSSLLLRGEITLLERKKDIENRNERYLDAVTSLEKLTPLIQSDSIKESNNKFVKKQKESRFYKDVQNLFVKTKTSNKPQKNKMENTSSENISYENEEMSKAAAIKERNQQKKLTKKAYKMILDQEDKEQMENISAAMKSATKDFMDLNATPITEERTMKSTENFESQEYWKNQFQQDNAETFKAIDDYLEKGIRPKNDEFIFEKVPEILKAANVSENELVIKTSIINKAKNEHSLSDEEIKDSIKNIASPVLIFNSDKTTTENKKESFLCLTDTFAENEKPIAFSMNLDSDYEKSRSILNVNQITSIHNRTLIAKNGTDLIQKWTENGLCRYVDDKKISEWQLAARVQFPLAVLHSDINNINLSPEIVNDTDYQEIRTFSEFAEQQKAMEKEYQEYLGTISPDEESSRRIDSGEIFGKLENQQSKEELNVATYKFQSGETLDEIIQGNSDFSTETALLDNLIDNSIREVYEYATNEEKSVLRQFAAFKNDYDTDMKNLAVQTDCISRWIAAEHWNPEKQEFQKEYVNKSAIKEFPYKLPWEMKEIEAQVLQTKNETIDKGIESTQVNGGMSEAAIEAEIRSQEKDHHEVEEYNDGQLPLQVVAHTDFNYFNSDKLSFKEYIVRTDASVVQDLIEKNADSFNETNSKLEENAIPCIIVRKSVNPEIPDQFLLSKYENNNLNKDEIAKQAGKFASKEIKIENTEFITQIKNVIDWNDKQNKTQAAIPKLKIYRTLKEDDVKNLEVISDQEFSDIVDSIILNDYKNIPNAIRLPNLNEQLSEKLGLEKDSAFILKKNATHIRPDRKGGYGQAFDAEEYRRIPEILRNADFAVVDTVFQNFQIVFDDKNDGTKINKLVFNKDELGNYLVTLGKVDRESAFSEERNPIVAVGVAPTIQTLRTSASSTALRASTTMGNESIAQSKEKASSLSKNYAKVAVGVEPTIWRAQNEHPIATMLRSSTTLATEETIAQAAEKSINEQKIKMPDQLVYAAAKVGQVIEQRVQNELGIVNPTRDDRLSTISVPLNKDYNEDFSLSTEKNMSKTQKSINEQKTKLQIIEQEDKEQLAAIVMTARKTIKESLAQNAEPLVEVDFSKANYDRLFPRAIVQTPVETVKLGENQFEKLDARDRKRFLLATFQTLATPDLVIDEEREGKHSHNYIKSFVFDEKTKTIQDVVVNINGENVSITAHPRDINNIVNKIKMPDQLVYAAARVGQVIEQRTQEAQSIVNPTRDDRLSTISVPLNKEYNENFALSTVEKLLETEKNAQKATASDFQQIESALQKKFDKLKAAIKSREEQDIQDISAAEEPGNKKQAIRSKSDIIRQAGKDFLKSVKEGIAPFFNAEDDFQRIIMHPQAIINASNGLPFSGESQLLAQIYHQRQRMEGEVVTSIAGAKAAGTIVLDTPESRQKNFALTDTSSLAEKNAIVRTRYFMPESCEEPDKIYAHTLQRQRPDKIRSYRDLIRHFENIPNGQKEISDIRIRIAHEHLKEIQSRFAIKEKRVLSVDEIEERKNFLRNYFERLPADYRNSERSAFEDTFGIQLNSEKNLEINLQRDFKDIDFAELKKNTKKSIELENRKLSDFIEKNTMEDKKLATLLSDEYKSLSKEEKMTVRNLKIEAIGIKEPETFLGKYLAACNTNAEFITDKETVEEVKKNLVKKLEENFKLEKYDILKEIGQQAQSIGNETTKKISFEKAHSNNKSLEKTQSPDKEISLIGMGK